MIDFVGIRLGFVCSVTLLLLLPQSAPLNAARSTKSSAHNAEQRAAEVAKYDAVRGALEQAEFKIARADLVAADPKQVYLGRPSTASLIGKITSVSVVESGFPLSGFAMTCESEFHWNSPLPAQRDWESPLHAVLVIKNLATGHVQIGRSNPIIRASKGQPGRTWLAFGARMETPGKYAITIVIVGSDSSAAPRYLLDSYHRVMVLGE